MGQGMCCVRLGKSLLIVLAAALAFAASPANANSKYAAYVVHAESGDVLFDRYSTARRYPASLTKMMTLYLLFEKLEAGEYSLDTKLKVSARAAGQPPSKLGVRGGSTIDVKTAIEALVIKSANDVAVVVAENMAGSEWRFAQEMTAKARRLGMSRTTFRNASGLPNSKQITTARDMAILGRRVMQDFPQYFPYFAQKSFSYNGRTYSTHNSLVKSYDGADGIKTGYTRGSGFNLVTSATKRGESLIGVVLGGRSSYTRDRHMREILDQGFAKIRSNPALIAALHRRTPAPRLKPSLIQIAAKEGAPTVGGDAALQAEIAAAAAALAAPTSQALADLDNVGALIAAASDDFNEYERNRIALAATAEGFLGEGDRERPDEFAWGVQIGAYSTKALAQSELETAARRGGLLERDRAVLPTPRPDGRTLYRARFRALTEIEATLACASLKDEGVSCFVVSDADS